MNKRDYYEVLGLPKTATKQEIKSAYRKLAKEFHPDRNKAADAETKFKEVQEAYEALSDERKKEAYDKYGFAGAQSFGGGGGFNPYGQAGGFSDGGFSFDMGDLGNDIFSQLFGDSFGGFGSARRGNAVSRGEDLEFSLKIDFMEAVFGGEKTLSYKRKIACSDCKGTGAKDAKFATCSTCKGQGRIARIQRTFLGNIQTVTDCHECRGAGKIPIQACPVCKGHGVNETREDFKIKIPHGIPDGVTLRFKERGNSGRKGGTYGDLYVTIEVSAHDKFERKGDDIYSDLAVDITEAVLGAVKTVPTVHGNVELKINPGTQPESVLRMSGKGAPRFQGSGNGDQYVKIIIQIPSRLTQDQKEHWQKLYQLKEQRPGFMDSLFN
jgi:molecular chaperone DnaJ